MFIKGATDMMLCMLKQKILGDIMGYDNKECLLCDENTTTVARYSSFTCDTNDENSSTLKDCDFCRNANTDDELSHDNDLSYMCCGRVIDDNYQIHLRTGDKRKTLIIIDQKTERGWKPIAEIIPNNCPFCGRILIENKMYRR